MRGARQLGACALGCFLLAGTPIQSGPLEEQLANSTASANGSSDPAEGEDAVELLIVEPAHPAS